MTNPPFVVDENGYTKPTYEQHPTYDGRGMDEAGRLVRVYAPFFECSYQLGKTQEAVEGEGEGIVQRLSDGTFVRTFNLIMKDETQITSEAVKKHALLHAGLWVYDSNQIKPRKDDLKLMWRDECVLQGEEEPDAIFTRDLPEDPESIPF